MLLFWIAFILTRPLRRARNILSRRRSRRLDWGTPAQPSAGGASSDWSGIKRFSPPQPAAAAAGPINRRTGEPQRPNGQLITLPQS
jgi:hypothetical protein